MTYRRRLIAMTSLRSITFPQSSNIGVLPMKNDFAPALDPSVLSAVLQSRWDEHFAPAEPSRKSSLKSSRRWGMSLLLPRG